LVLPFHCAYPVVPGIQKIPFKVCGWFGIAIYCFFHELEVISACFPVDMSAMMGAQRPVADDTLLTKLWMSFLPIRFLANGLNKKMEIIQTIDVFVHFIFLHQYPVKKTAAHWKFLREKMCLPHSPTTCPSKHTKRIANKTSSIFWAFISKSSFSQKNCAAVKGLIY
jgi:hypothetical protein